MDLKIINFHLIIDISKAQKSQHINIKLGPVFQNQFSVILTNLTSLAHKIIKLLIKMCIYVDRR